MIGCRLHTAGLQWVYSDSTVSTGFLPRARRVYSGQGTSAYCRRPGKRKTTHTCTHADMCMCTCMWGGAVCCAVVSLEALYGRYHTTKSGSTGHLNTTKWVRGARRKCSVTDILQSVSVRKGRREIFSLSLFFCAARATSFIHPSTPRLRAYPRREACPRQ